MCKALLRTPLPRSLLYLYFYLYFVLLYFVLLYLYLYLYLYLGVYFVLLPLLRTPLPRSLLYLYLGVYFVLLYLGVYSIDEESGLGEGGCGEGGRGEGSSQEDGSREGGGRERLVERLRQLVNGPVAPPSPRTGHKTDEKGAEMSSDRSFGRPYSGSRPVASEPALRSYTSRSSTSNATPILLGFDEDTTFQKV